MRLVPFKICPTCKVVWETMDAFLSDEELNSGGYQVNFLNLKGGMFYFTHYSAGCGTTMALPVQAFSSLSDRSLLAPSGKGTDDCPGLCVRIEDSTPCPEECECVWVREVLQKLLHYNNEKLESSP